MAFLSGWLYRKPVTLSRASGAVSNYQMRLKVGESAGSGANDVLATGCKTDFSDLRFTKVDGTTLLDYWIESISGTTPNQVAMVWIEFDSIGTGATTFYLYYGNAGASAVSSGANTFILFDDFERGVNGDTIGGNWTEAIPHVHISTDHAYGGTRCAKHVGGTNPNATIPLTVSADIAIQCRFWNETLPVGGYYFRHGDGVKTFHTYTDMASLQYYDGAPHATGINITRDTWQKLEWKNINFAAGTYDIYLNDSLAKSGATMWTNSEYSNKFFLGISSAAADKDCYVDNLIARNWRSTEPAWGSWGAEELGLQHYTLTMDAGSFSMAGTAILLPRSAISLGLSPGAFSMVGSPLSIWKVHPPMILEPGAFAMTGSALSIKRPVSYMRMDPGAFAMNGTPMVLNYSWYRGVSTLNYQFPKQRRQF